MYTCMLLLENLSVGALYIFLSVSQYGYILPLDFCNLSLYEPENFCHRLPQGIHSTELEIVISVALNWCCRGALTPIFSLHQGYISLRGYLSAYVQGPL